ncbi:deoxyribose-phosphate aldolase [Oceanihabitans sediminis]|uniref:Deoxyribose-phosphate aldolase n=1 Tax=Oceanihabitans sediminis TaxID=1812012 RepID=A0A368P610_9FLAO|nr:deoxyribose-phosphate aldolase [Oceanihabitans sediminis]MDX1773299.1 deoxyribose-phosphate aldolase [Oceanihabitans sediminis]RBP32730.1 deoxyribose-phosphate aldolase [Oceanihabitans sediminis]RCU57730.1 deoxyribose-phosphate aldolase [Oceanihabitans sediminis]
MKLNKYIDHTLLKAIATKSDIIQLCNEAKENDFFSVCVNSSYVALAKKELQSSSVKVCSVIGFPLGAMSTQAKVAETKQALLDGADEIDMVMNIGALKSKDFEFLSKDIEAVKNAMPNNTLKVILETCYLEESEIIKASILAIKAGADFIKTSTGFGTGGASIKDVELMKSVLGDSKVKIKASGGIRDTSTALAYINIGVERIGTSNGIAIVTGGNSKENNY